jgi:hypothetical protein
MATAPRSKRMSWLAVGGPLVALVAMLTLAETDTAMLKTVKTVTGLTRCLTTAV